MSHLPTPVLLVGFNRPEHSARVFEVVRRIRPAQLFVALDGPRDDTDRPLCAAVARTFLDVDWPCDLAVRSREYNLGCHRAVPDAITWFFEHVPEGIILEDDIVPDPSFFPFCTELLERHRAHESVWMISGFNPLGRWRRTPYSYIWGPGAVWGWATWRRAWTASSRLQPTDLSDMSLAAAQAFVGDEWWDHASPVWLTAVDSSPPWWDFSWFLSMAIQQRYAAVPRVSLVQNIGAGPGATHDTDPRSPYGRVRSQRLTFPLRHPTAIALDHRFQRAVLRMDRPSPLRRVARRLRDTIARPQPTMAPRPPTTASGHGDDRWRRP